MKTPEENDGRMMEAAQAWRNVGNPQVPPLWILNKSENSPKP